MVFLRKISLDIEFTGPFTINVVAQEGRCGFKLVGRSGAGINGDEGGRGIAGGSADVGEGMVLEEGSVSVFGTSGLFLQISIEEGTVASVKGS